MHAGNETALREHCALKTRACLGIHVRNLCEPRGKLCIGRAEAARTGGGRHVGCELGSQQFGSFGDTRARRRPQHVQQRLEDLIEDTRLCTMQSSLCSDAVRLGGNRPSVDLIGEPKRIIRAVQHNGILTCSWT